MSKIIDTAEMLHDRSAAAAHTLLHTCLQHQWGYRMRTCRGDESIVSAMAKVDEALKRGLLSYSPHDVLNDELSSSSLDELSSSSLDERASPCA